MISRIMSASRIARMEPVRGWGRRAWAVALFLAPAVTASAQAPARVAQSEPGSNLTVHLMTMGVGEQVWERFGHNAIWIRDEASGQDLVYNWGLFDFNQPNFIPRFLQGRMLYSMGAFDTTQTLWQYRQRDRSVWVQELDLSNAQKAQLDSFVRWNAQPQNRDYRYDYFRDNCSTRVRDVLDLVLGGALRRASEGVETSHTYRDHALRLTSPQAWLAAGIDIGLGPFADKRLTRWEEFFIPMELQAFARRMVLTDANGVRRPLVKREQVLYESTSRREPTVVPAFGVPFVAIGALLAALIAGLTMFARRGSARARTALRATVATFAGVAGFLGTLLVLLWTVTDHVSAHANENIHAFNPVWLLLAVLAPLALAVDAESRRPRVVKLARWTAWFIVGFAALSLVIHATGAARQPNLRIVALAGLPALAIAWALGWRSRRAA